MAALALALAAAVLGSATTAYAEPTARDIESVLRETAPEVLRDRADRVSSSAPASSTRQLTVGVGDDATELVSLRSGAAPTLATGTKARLRLKSRLANGNPTYRLDAGIDVVPLVKQDQSVQVVTILNARSSRERVRYTLDFAEGFDQTTITDDGSVLFLNDGQLVGGAAAPWARDSAGREIPTRYEVDGRILTQVIEHRNQQGVRYPVVADPWLGRDLFSRTWTTTYQGDTRYNLRKSLWGQAMHTPTIAGQAIMNVAGWAEAVAKLHGITSKRSVKQQYECHVGGGYGTLAGDWNLERVRPTRTVHWSYGVLVHRCNWTTANRY